VKFPSFDFEIWCSQGFRVTVCCDLDVWPFDLINVSQALIHTSRDFGEISSNIHEYVVFTRYFGSLLAVTLTFDFLTPKSNQHIYESKYICGKNWVKLPSLVCETWCRPPLVTMTSW